MGRKHKNFNTRECLMNNLKQLFARLGESPCCQMKPFNCCPCGASPGLSDGPLRRQCFLVPNSCSSHSSFISKSESVCGPFPPSCVDIFSYKSGKCCAPDQNAPLCQNPINCFCKRDSGLCSKPNYHCCKPRCSCGIRKCQCSRFQCNSYCMPNFQYLPCRCKPAICNYLCSCKNSPCSMKFRNCPAGNICFGCNTICLPRSYSDTGMTKKKINRKSLRCSRSVELRGGTMYVGCDCDKKNGLQDRCLRYCCINNPKCKLNPATCHCSKFSCGKHLSQQYARRKGHRKCTCYVCQPNTCFVPFSPCYPCPENKKCCCRKEIEHGNEKECGCQCCPSMQEAQCLCSLEALTCPKQTSMSPLDVCCPNNSPCLSPCPSPCLSPCPSPCSVECPLSCYAKQSTSCQEPFCSCCNESCQRSPPIMCHASSNSCCYMCGQKECICNKRTQCAPQSVVYRVPCKSPCCKVCNYRHR